MPLVIPPFMTRSHSRVGFRYRSVMARVPRLESRPKQNRASRCARPALRSEAQTLAVPRATGGPACGCSGNPIGSWGSPSVPYRGPEPRHRARRDACGVEIGPNLVKRGVVPRGDPERLDTAHEGVDPIANVLHFRGGHLVADQGSLLPRRSWLFRHGRTHIDGCIDRAEPQL